MIPLSRAKNLILKNTSFLPVEQKDFQAALGRSLAQDIIATSDWPPFARATMDGFALRSVDVSFRQRKTSLALAVVGESKAGRPFSRVIRQGQAVKISTGAVVPRGADSVVARECAKMTGGKVFILQKVFFGQYIRRQGDDAKKGAKLILQGAAVTPGVVALLANLGQTRIKVYKTPRVGIITTGDELVGLGSNLRVGQIRSCNEYGLAAQVTQLGVKPFILGRAKDDLVSLTQKVRQGLSYDVLLISGGVSVGDHDLVRRALKKLNVREIFWKVAVKPGKPLVFAKKGKCHVFGLPGNTVASMVSFYTFVLPCIAKMSGRLSDPSYSTEAILAQDIFDADQRTKIFRGIVFERKGKRYVRLSADQISENILSMAKANSLFTVKAQSRSLKKGTRVKIEYMA